ncbi:P-loop ATPase, Sll1717 family [Phenylobacterium sp.]|uniref:P-loop ATPase, Sll1717 family n=1 Tax=Phenylobacterium sp. TaxID=1871053 RepID=UPI0027333EAC|nr:hypothetical protein [Phenylobacterium sp.]MDP3855099.1 hypothetical protein [Phenylobacterium sp.]
MADRFRRAFFAFPAAPPDLARTIERASELANARTDRVALTAWPQLDVFGALIPDQVRAAVEAADVVVCDITIPNRNVYYEAGYGIGLGKAVAPVVNSSYAGAMAAVQRDGFFDNVGFRSYDNSEALAKLLIDLPETKLSDLYSKDIDRSQPIYLLDAFRKTDFRNAITAGIKATKVFYRTFDPVEVPRFSTASIVGDASASSGVIIPLLAEHVDDSERHNLRAAFLAGLSHGLGRDTLILKLFRPEENDPADFRSNVTSVTSEAQVADLISEFAPRALLASQNSRAPKAVHRRNALQQLSLGASAAENEFRVLQEYFVETSEFLRTLRGEVSVVAGRKGSGKSAIFFRVRDTLSQKKRALVTDLKPESHQLSLFREELLKVVDLGAFDHTLAAFWYFVVLSELAITLKRRFEHRAQFDSSILSNVTQIERVLAEFDVRDSGDFTARINRLGRYIVEEVQAASKQGKSLSPDRLTNIVFRHGISGLKKVIVENTTPDDDLFFLFDNIDKGWPANGVDEFDVRLVRLLLESLEKVSRDLNVLDRELHSITFLRNDIYELLIDATPDRGKSGQVRIDWTDRAKLRQVIFKRLESSTNSHGATFQVLWAKHFVNNVSGRESFEYFVDHCLMRPRFLINIIENSVANAVNRGNIKVEAGDCVDAVRQHANYLVDDFGYEIRDASGISADILYSLIGIEKEVSKSDVLERFRRSGIPNDELDEAFRLMLWYGVIGIRSQSGSERYIYDVDYNMKRLEAEVRAMRPEALFIANDAIHVGLST